MTDENSTLFRTCPFIRNSWLKLAHRKEEPSGWDEKGLLIRYPQLPGHNELYESEWSHRYEKIRISRRRLGAVRGFSIFELQVIWELYEKYRRNRMVMGAFRYAQMKYSNYSNYDLIGEAKKKRLAKFDDDLNLEHLIDAGNIVMLEFIQYERVHGRQDFDPETQEYPVPTTWVAMFTSIKWGLNTYPQTNDVGWLPRLGNLIEMAFAVGLSLGLKMIAQDDSEHAEWKGE